MPELPDVILYVEALDRLLTGESILNVRVRSPFVLRTFSPGIEEIVGKRVVGFSRRGKRVVWHFDDGPHVVVHPMIAGRFHWKKPDYRARSKNDLIAFDFHHGVIVMTEAAKKKRAGIWVLKTVAEVDQLDPGGIDALACEFGEFKDQLCKANNTLKRALADPRRFDGIGNAFGDEILHAARLSPMKRTFQLTDPEVTRLHSATRSTLKMWIDRLRAQTGSRFPEKVTAFRSEMAVHGKFKEPCPECSAPIQRIRYAENECNYCPGCQTEGRILSDRSLARLLKEDWPKTLDDLEDMEDMTNT